MRTPYRLWPADRKAEHLARVQNLRTRYVASGLCRCGRAPVYGLACCTKCKRSASSSATVAVGLSQSVRT